VNFLDFQGSIHEKHLIKPLAKYAEKKEVISFHLAGFSKLFHGTWFQIC
jgi:hypothetical protein